MASHGSYLGKAEVLAGRMGSLLALAVIAGYRAAIAPQLVGACRFTPTCSHYAEEAIVRHGLWHGGALAIKRLVRCHPFDRTMQGGWDPVPETLDR